MSVTVCLDEPVTAECTCLRLLVYIHVYSTRMLVLWLHVYNMCHCLCQFDPLHTCSPCYGMSSRYVSTHVCILVWYAMCVWNISTDVKLVPDVFDFDFKEVYQCLQGVPGALMRPVLTKHSSVACDIDGDAHRRTCITCPCRGGKRLNPRTSMSSFLHPVIFWTWFVKTWMIKNLYFGLHNSGLWCKFSDIFWKGMPICHTYGVLPWSLMVFFMKDFLQPNAVYIRFTHIVSMQPKIYVGSATRSTLDRESSRTRKYLQLEHDKFVQAELALRFGVITAISLFGLQSIFLFIEQIIDASNSHEFKNGNLVWHYPLMCQFFHPRKGLLKKPAMNTNAQFGLASLWRTSKHKFTPKVVRDILASDRFQSRLELWQIIHALGSNTKARSRPPRCFDLTMVASLCATCSEASTFELQHPGAIPNSHFRQLMPPSNGGKGSTLHVLPHCELPGLWVQIWWKLYDNSFDDGIYRFYHIKLLVTLRRSKSFLPNTPQWWTSCATMNRQPLTGQQVCHLYAAAKHGPLLRRRVWIPVLNTGSSLAIFLVIFFLLNKRSLRKGLC